MFLSIVRRHPAPENWAEKHPTFQHLSEARERHRKITSIHMLILVFIWRITQQSEHRFLSVRQQIWSHSKAVGKLLHSSGNTPWIPGMKCNGYLQSFLTLHWTLITNTTEQKMPPGYSKYQYGVCLFHFCSWVIFSFVSFWGGEQGCILFEMQYQVNLHLKKLTKNHDLGINIQHQICFLFQIPTDFLQ